MWWEIIMEDNIISVLAVFAAVAGATWLANRIQKVWLQSALDRMIEREMMLKMSYHEAKTPVAASAIAAHIELTQREITRLEEVLEKQ